MPKSNDDDIIHFLDALLDDCPTRHPIGAAGAAPESPPEPDIPKKRKMDENAAIPNLSEDELFVVFEHVFEYISDIPTLASLTLVNKRVRNTVYRWNGLRVLNCQMCYENEKRTDVFLKELYIGGNNQEKRLKDGLRWLWTIGKRLCLVQFGNYWSFFDSVLPLLNSLAPTEKRKIETIDFRGIPCEMAFDLVRENRNTLRFLRVELWDQQFVSSFRSELRRETCSLYEIPESQSFWSVVGQCERLGSLALCLKNADSIPTELINVLRGTPLKYLSLRDYSCQTNSEVLQKFVEVLLSSDNIRNKLESLRLDKDINILQLLLGGLTGAVIINVKRFTFDFVQFCSNQNSINWSVFLTVFPALNEIKDNSYNSSYWVINTPDIAIVSQNVSFLCKTYLDASESHSRELKIEIGPSHGSITQKLIEAVATAATLPEDQAWCDSHGVQIETETRDEKVQKVTLRKDTLTLVFDLK